MGKWEREVKRKEDGDGDTTLTVHLIASAVLLDRLLAFRARLAHLLNQLFALLVLLLEPLLERVAGFALVPWAVARHARLVAALVAGEDVVWDSRVQVDGVELVAFGLELCGTLAFELWLLRNGSGYSEGVAEHVFGDLQDVFEAGDGAIWENHLHLISCCLSSSINDTVNLRVITLDGLRCSLFRRLMDLAGAASRVETPAPSWFRLDHTATVEFVIPGDQSARYPVIIRILSLVIELLRRSKLHVQPRHCFVALRTRDLVPANTIHLVLNPAPEARFTGVDVVRTSVRWAIVWEGRRRECAIAY